MEQSLLWYPVGPCWWSILQVIHFTWHCVHVHSNLRFVTCAVFLRGHWVHTAVRGNNEFLGPSHRASAGDTRANTVFKARQTEWVTPVSPMGPEGTDHRIDQRQFWMPSSVPHLCWHLVALWKMEVHSYWALAWVTPPGVTSVLT